MTKRLFSLAGFTILSMTFLLVSFVYLGQNEVEDNEENPCKTSVQNHYEMPNFIPAVWVGIN